MEETEKTAPVNTEAIHTLERRIVGVSIRNLYFCGWHGSSSQLTLQIFGVLLPTFVLGLGVIRGTSLVSKFKQSLSVTLSTNGVVFLTPKCSRNNPMEEDINRYESASFLTLWGHMFSLTTQRSSNIQARCSGHGCLEGMLWILYIALRSMQLQLPAWTLE